MSTYEFTQRDNIVEPQTYMYSTASLAEYGTAREDIRNWCLNVLRENAPETVLKPFCYTLSHMATDFRQITPFPSVTTASGNELNQAQDYLSNLDDTIRTNELLDHLLTLELGDRQNDTADKYWILLQRRFEVKKRIWTQYTKTLRPASDEYQDLVNYAKLAAGFGLRASRTGDYRTVNVLLKSNDTLQSVIPRDPNNAVIRWSLLAFDLEQTIINQLIAQTDNN